MAIKLYSYWRSSAAYRVRIALNLKELEYEIVPVSLAPGEAEHRQDAYRSINPQMLVPFLDDGHVAIGQSQAILEYLEEVYPKPRLLPESSEDRARVRAFCNLISCDIHPLNNLRVLMYLQAPLSASTKQRDEWYRHWIAEGFQAAEQFVNASRDDGPYAFGGNLTLADILLVPQMYNARRFNVPIDAYPRLIAIDKACNELPAFQEAAPEQQPDSTQ